MPKKPDIIIAKSAGFCPGVQHAIDQVIALTTARKKPIYTLGPLIHNTQVTTMLEMRGIKTIEKPAQAEDKRGILVIRAHGITPQLQREIEACEISVFDATCPLVKHAQNIIAKFAVQNYHTVIVGDKEHAEVVGLIGYTRGRYDVVSNLKEAQALPHFEKVNVVSQTTQPESTFYEIAQEIKKHADECQISNTICQPTKDRQKETIEQAKNADLVVVVGGKHSANTVRLAQLCQGLCPHVQHVETEDELDEKQVVQAKQIFVTAGASTPKWVIDSVVFRIKTLRDRANRKIVYRYKPGEKK